MSDCYIHAAEMMLVHYEGYRLTGRDTEHNLLLAAKQNKDVFYSTCKMIDTFKISPEAQHNRLIGKSNLNTYDHHISRSKSSFDFLHQWRIGAFTLNNIEDAGNWVKSRCTVNTVTRNQNNKLRLVQNDPSTRDCHWEEQYSIAGVKLEDKIDLSKRFIYIIDGIEYRNIEDVSEKYNISLSTVTNRCIKDRSGKYPNWIRKYVTEGSLYNV